MFKGIRLSVKLVGGFVIVALVTLAVGYLGWSGVSNMQSISEELVDYLQKIQVNLLAREVDHLNWARKVGQFQRDENMTTLDVQKEGIHGVYLNTLHNIF